MQIKQNRKLEETRGKLEGKLRRREKLSELEEMFFLNFEDFLTVFRIFRIDFVDENKKTRRHRAYEFLEAKLIQRRDFGTLY